MIFRCLLLALLLCVAGLRSSPADITVSLLTKHGQSPNHLTFEAGNFFYETDPGILLSFLSGFRSLLLERIESKQIGEPSSSREVFDALLDFHDRSGLGDASKTLLKFALGTRMASPKIAYFDSLARGFKLGTCEEDRPCGSADDVALQCGGAPEAQLAGGVASFMESCTSFVNATSHDYVIRRGAVNVAIYGDPLVETFVSVLGQALAAAESLDLGLVYRPYSARFEPSGFPLGGYAAELNVRDTRYNVVDPDLHSPLAEPFAPTSLDDHAFGYDASDTVPLADAALVSKYKDEELEGVSACAARHVCTAAEPLAALAGISQYLPFLLHNFVGNGSCDPDAEYAGHLEQLRTFIPAGESRLSLNGREVDISNLDFAAFYEIVRSELAVVDRLASLGVSPAGGRRLLLSLSESGQQDAARAPRVNLYAAAKDLGFSASRAIVYLNDVDSDYRYQGLSKSVDNIVSAPSYVGSPVKHVGRNLYTVLAVIDPTSVDGLRLLNTPGQFFHYNIPVRFGIVFALPAASAAGDAGAAPEVLLCEEFGLNCGGAAAAAGADVGAMDVTVESEQPADDDDKRKEKGYADIEEDSLGVQVARVLAGLQSSYGTEVMLAYVHQVFHYMEADSETELNVPLFKRSLKSLMSRLAAYYKGSEFESRSFAELASARAFDDRLRMGAALAREVGLAAQSFFVVNGRVLAVDGEDTGAESLLFSSLKEETLFLQHLVAARMLGDGDRDIMKTIIESAADAGSAIRRHHATAFRLPRAPQNVFSDDWIMGDGRLGLRNEYLSLETALVQDLMPRIPTFRDRATAFLTKKLTVWVFGDYRDARDVAQALRVLEAVRVRPEVLSDVRVAFVHSGAAREAGPVLNLIASPKAARRVGLDQIGPLLALAAEDTVLAAGGGAAREACAALVEAALGDRGFGHVPEDERGAERARVVKTVCKALAGEHAEAGALDVGAKMAAGLGFPPSHRGLFVNGLSVPTPEGAQPLDADHVAYLLHAVREKVALPIHRVLGEEELALPEEQELYAEYEEDVYLRISALFSQESFLEARSSLPVPSGLLDLVGVSLPSPNSHFDVRGYLDPFSPQTRRILPLLMFLRDRFSANMRILLNPPSELESKYQNVIYKPSLPVEPRFAADGSELPIPPVEFRGLPHKAVLTLKIDAPVPWMLDCIAASTDNDNIVLSAAGQTRSVYELSHILIQGHCWDDTHAEPPRGLKLALRGAGGFFQDTLVMSNLGYFQLKASPGNFALEIAGGRSSALYRVRSGGAFHERVGLYPSVVGDDVLVDVASFQGTTVVLKVEKRPGMKSQPLLVLGDADDADEAGLWDKVKRTFSKGEGAASKSDEDETINVFSIASGHLYERLQRIMIYSVMKHTKRPVHFWFLQTYVSPKYKNDELPYLAERLGFNYTLIAYQWPSWLRRQQEHQRTIWGYKILFLDTIFPQSVKKFIFVDADQVTRTDLGEVYDMDFHGAPLALTPIGDSREDVEGFRFWKRGYWEEHLQGKNYHITALFVVDLERFRQMGAADRFRVLYESLSKDKNSLSNLDQDLPNYAQHEVPIFSLPDEWLWCASWNSQDSKKYAKTIDLCNDPKTKMTKIESARANIEEWDEYDLAVKAILAERPNP